MNFHYTPFKFAGEAMTHASASGEVAILFSDDKGSHYATVVEEELNRVAHELDFAYLVSDEKYPGRIMTIPSR